MVAGQWVINPQHTCRWKEQVPVRSQARRMHPGQAQCRVPAMACTRIRWAVQSLPCCAGAPQGLQQLTGQTHPCGMTITLSSGCCIGGLYVGTV